MENGIKIIKKELNEEKKYDILNKILDEEFMGVVQINYDNRNCTSCFINDYIK